MTSDVSLDGATAQAIRTRERSGFDRVAATYSATSRDLLRAARERLLARAGLEPGQIVLDVCTGPGWLALDAAARVGPDGRVVGVDLAPKMVARAEANARDAALSNLDFRVMDAEQLQFADASFDRVLCSLGLMHIPDPVRAAAEMARVARPGARLAVSVHGPADRTFLGLIAESLRVAAGDRLPVDLGYVTRLGPPGVLEDVLRRAGWTDIAVEQVDNPRLMPSGEEAWTAYTAVGGLFSSVVAELPPGAVAATRAEFVRRAERHRRGESVVLPALQLVATAVRAAG